MRFGELIPQRRGDAEKTPLNLRDFVTSWLRVSLLPLRPGSTSPAPGPTFDPSQIRTQRTDRLDRQHDELGQLIRMQGQHPFP